MCVRKLRDQIRNMTRMQLLRTCAAWRPDTDAFRGPVTATCIAIKSVCQRILHLHDEIGLFDAQIAALVDQARNYGAVRGRRHRRGRHRADVRTDDVTRYLPDAPPDLWQRYLAIIFDGLRPEGAHPLPQPPPAAP